VSSGRRRVYIETYGCQMNEADSQMLRGLLGEAGWEVTEAPAAADVILINTCAVRQRAEDRVVGRVRHLARLRRARPGMRIGLIGCMAAHRGRSLLEELPECDLLIGPDSYRRLAEILGSGEGEALIDLALDKHERYEGITPAEAGGVHAWIPIMRGCDRFCTFCVVPFVRGREKSLPAHELTQQITRLASSGTVAVTLLGQTVNSYSDGDVDFAALLDRIAQIPGLLRIRFTSPHPADFTLPVFEVMARHRNLCKHLHVPVQSGSNRILDAMKRGHTREEFLALVERIRESLGEVSITTDLLAGFPGETADEFDETLSLMRQVRFDSAFLFRYSPRPGTYAARKMADDVPDAEKARRLRAMIDLQEEISAERYARWIDREVEVLVEGVSRRDPACVRGKTDDFKTVVLPGGQEEIGTMRSVRIARASSHTLVAEGITAQKIASGSGSGSRRSGT
jgi:tRNA-2-methylthio-N6-dimethylallyladenosine synthase